MKSIQELRRIASPAPKPQCLSWDGTILWMGSRASGQIYALDPSTLAVRWQTPAPGTPYGMVACSGELRVVCSETAEDHRIIRRCIPYQGFDQTFALPCPDDTGSQLSYDGRQLYGCQWYAKKVLALTDSGQVERVITVPHEICGHVFVEGSLYLLTTDDEETTDYWLTRVDPRATTLKFEDLARIPFAARSLTYDGTHFWTNHREQNQIVSFARPD